MTKSERLQAAADLLDRAVELLGPLDQDGSPEEQEALTHVGAQASAVQQLADEAALEEMEAA